MITTLKDRVVAALNTCKSKGLAVDTSPPKHVALVIGRLDESLQSHDMEEVVKHIVAWQLVGGECTSCTHAAEIEHHDEAGSVQSE